MVAFGSLAILIIARIGLNPDSAISCSTAAVDLLRLPFLRPPVFLLPLIRATLKSNEIYFGNPATCAICNNGTRETIMRRQFLDERAKAIKREELIENPFDPRKEVSADARHIAKHLWILGVAVPVAAAVLLWLLR